MRNITIAFIGGGNMATSLLGGLVAAGHDPARLRVAEPDAGKAAQLHERLGVHTTANGQEAVEGAALVVLAVKPQVMRAALAPLHLASGTAVLSIAAGIRLDTLRRWLGDELPLIRSMPNTPSLFGAGISGLYAGPDTPASAREAAQYVLDAAGRCCWVASEPLLDAVTAVSGSGPAYVFQLCEMMRDAGVTLGLTPDVAEQLAVETIAGAARMLKESGDSAETLRAKVTSKGGTTAAAIEALEERQIGTLYNAALGAAARRAQALGDELDRE